MKTATFNTFFKLTAADKEAGKTTKRPDLVVSYNSVDSTDILNGEVNQDRIAYIVNQSLESYAKRLIAANKDNWDYCPEVKDITVDNLYAELTAESTRGKRTLTKESLAAFAQYYETIGAKLIGKSATAAKNGAHVISLKLAPIAANKDAIANFSATLENLAVHEEFDSAFEGIIVALMEILSEALNMKVEIDDL